jgi:SAM-dependent methyltransferase
MLARARAATEDGAVVYVRADLEIYEPEPAAFDLVYSSLAFHYVEHFDRLLCRIHAALVAGGRLIFSVEHPIFTAPGHPGWMTSPGGDETWPVDRYLDEGPRRAEWLGARVLKQHRMIGTYLALLRESGFSISRLCEWGPSREQVAAQPDWARERQRPLFLLIAASVARSDAPAI